MSNPTSNTVPNTEETTVNNAAAESAATDNRWVARFEELLTVKNVDDLKSELTKIAAEIQKEMQSFDIDSYLSPTAKERLKTLETRYNMILRQIAKAQKQFDREFNRSVRVLKKTRQEAEKQIKDIQVKITKQRSKILAATKNLKKKLKVGKKSKKTTRKSGTARRAKKKKTA